MRPSSRDGTTFTRRQKRVAPSKSGSRRLSVKRNTSRSYGNPMRNWKIEITKKRLARRKKNRAIDEQKPAGEKVPDPVDGRPWSDTHTHTHTQLHTHKIQLALDWMDYLSGSTWPWPNHVYVCVVPLGFRGVLQRFTAFVWLLDHVWWTLLAFQFRGPFYRTAITTVFAGFHRVSTGRFAQLLLPCSPTCICLLSWFTRWITFVNEFYR